MKSLWALFSNKTSLQGTSVLSEIDLQVKKGESVAIIGNNGAGKSTLLKIISGVIKPTTGSVTVNGRIGALLELGSGFHPEYTGRENLRMSATLVGMSAKQINTHMQQMIDFADIGQYIDQPVKNYSSGMIVRLGFSLVTVTKPDLLITDEVLAVGDTDFQRKCIAWIDAYLHTGGTLLLVSHSIYHVQKLCKKALWLEHGKIKKFGDSFLVSQEYQSHHSDHNDHNSQQENASLAQEKTSTRISQFKILNQHKQEIEETQSHENIVLAVRITTDEKIQPGLCLAIKQGEYPIYVTTSKLQQLKIQNTNSADYQFMIEMPKNKLLPGHYNFIVQAMDTECRKPLSSAEKTLKITAKTHDMGTVILPSKWN